LGEHPSGAAQLVKAQDRLTSLTALQCELRGLFASRPTNRALAEVLQRIAMRLDASYAVVHARIGVHLLSEEWCRPQADIGGATREFVNATLWEAISTEEALCTRVPDAGEQAVVVTAVMYDQDVEPSGGAALVIHSTSKARVLQAVAQLEGILGFLALLVGGTGAPQRRVAERRAIEPHTAASHPTRLAFAIVSDLEARYGFDVTAIGFVDRARVAVTAITGVEDLRPANPGVAVIRAAMEECLDRGAAIVHDGGAQREHDCRLHAQWSATAQGTAVATVPLSCMGQIVAIVAVAQGAGTPITIDQMQLIAEELTGFAALVPLSRAAARSLPRHAADAACDGARRLFDGRHRRGLAALLLSALGALWLAFGSLDYSFTVPCSVKAADRRTISCPRAGVLAELFVRPGDRVREGQLLAALDAKDDYLRHAELTAEIASLDALIDHAIANRDSGERRVHEARRESALAQLAIVDASIGQAQIRAPQDGLVLEGDLREQLGARLEMGERLFELARYDAAAVVLRIPERLVLAAHDYESATFAPTARPSEVHALAELRIAPAGNVVDGANVFLAEGRVALDLESLPPGMEGTARVATGTRSAFWVLTHRITDWLRLNFWL
jgi:hypothetical protein